jgi:hypothetical protein
MISMGSKLWLRLDFRISQQTQLFLNSYILLECRVDYDSVDHRHVDEGRSVAGSCVLRFRYTVGQFQLSTMELSNLIVLWSY